MKTAYRSSAEIEDEMMKPRSWIVCTTLKTLVLALATCVLSVATVAQAQHGGQIQKSCTRIKKCAGKCSITAKPCGTNQANCGIADGVCVAGPVCTSEADCGAISSTNPAWCVGGLDGGSTQCTFPSTTGCRGAAECSTCIPAEVADLGDTMTCEILVQNTDSFMDTIAVSSLTDTVRHGSGDQLFDLLDPGVASLYGTCSIPFGKRCSSDLACTFPGTCSLKRRCVDQNSLPFATAGAACTGSGQSTCPAGQLCSIVLLPDTFSPGQGDFVGALHTDLVADLKMSDPTHLRDNASAGGVDFGVVGPTPFNQFTLTFPGQITVNPGCTGVGTCKIDIDGQQFCDATSGPCSLQAAVDVVGTTNKTSAAPQRTIKIHGICVGDPVMVDGFFNVLITGDPPSVTTFDGCSGAFGPPPGTLNSTIARKAPPFVVRTGSNGEVIKIRNSSRVTVKYLNIRDGRYPTVPPTARNLPATQSDDGIDIKASTASRAFCNCIVDNEEPLDVDGGACNQVIQNTVMDNENGIRVSGATKSNLYRANTLQKNDLAQTETASDPSGRHDGLIISATSTGNNFLNNMIAMTPDDGVQLFNSNGNCVVGNTVTASGGDPNAAAPPDTGACEIVTSSNNKVDGNTFSGNVTKAGQPSNACRLISGSGNCGSNLNPPVACATSGCPTLPCTTAPIP